MEFKPLKSHFLSIWNSLYEQSHVHSLVAVMDNRIVGYGSIVIETNIRGGKMLYIEDIVSYSLFHKKGICKTVVDALFNIGKDGYFKVAYK